MPFEGFLKGFFIHVDQDDLGGRGGSAPLFLHILVMMVPVLLMMAGRNTTALSLIAIKLQGALENAFNDSYSAIIAGGGALGCWLGIWDQHVHSLWTHIYEDGLDQVDED